MVFQTAEKLTASSIYHDVLDPRVKYQPYHIAILNPVMQNCYNPFDFYKCSEFFFYKSSFPKKKV